MKITDKSSIKEIIPDVGDCWAHSRGNIYEVFIRIPDEVGRKYYEFTREEVKGKHIIYSIVLSNGALCHSRTDLDAIVILDAEVVILGVK
jgi:hypothetical protein